MPGALTGAEEGPAEAVGPLTDAEERRRRPGRPYAARGARPAGGAGGALAAEAPPGGRDAGG
ncbi:hypothetical protein ACE1SV_67660 [Streptomyces sennicomposti]